MCSNHTRNHLPVWKVCIAQPRYRARNFDALIYLLVNFANLGRISGTQFSNFPVRITYTAVCYPHKRSPVVFTCLLHEAVTISNDKIYKFSRERDMQITFIERSFLKNYRFVITRIKSRTLESQSSIRKYKFVHYLCSYCICCRRKIFDLMAEICYSSETLSSILVRIVCSLLLTMGCCCCITLHPSVRFFQFAKSVFVFIHVLLDDLK